MKIQTYTKKYGPPALMIQIIADIIGADNTKLTANFFKRSIKKNDGV
jgi:hypothetical protein